MSSPVHVAAAARKVTEIRPRSSWFDLDLESVWRFRELLWFLTLRDLKVRYKQAILGVLWAVIQPAFTVLVFTIIFGAFARIPSDGIPYPLFSFSAVLPWTLFSESMRRSALGLVGDAALLSKVYFPRLVVPLSNVLTPAVDFFIALLMFVLLMLFYGVLPTANLLALPLLFVMTLLLGFSIGLWLGPLNVRYRDIAHILPLLLQLWMYATPIVYPLSLVPEEWRALYDLNPMVGLIEGYRWALLGKGDLELQAIATGFLVMIGLLATGLVFFRRSERVFADII